MVAITGSTGFVGKNLIQYFANNSNTNLDLLNIRSDYNINNDTKAIIHLAGLAHDVKNKFSNNLYYEVNYEITKKLFDKFLLSNAKIFIYISSIKAATDFAEDIVDENIIPNPTTDYGKSKLMSENYLLSFIGKLKDKRIYVLRPTMIYGPNNKGNINLLYNYINKRLPWPLASYENKRSLCFVGNLSFVISELLLNDIPSGIYNICDDQVISTNEIINLIGKSNNFKPKLFFLPKWHIRFICNIGDFLFLPINNDRLNKLTQSFIVNNSKIKKHLNKALPYNTNEELLNTFKNLN